jgi:mRNA-degrading endonuclease RelE of RelBE toxin-antitoxin system
VKRILILPSFERSVKKLARQDKDDLAESLESFNLFLLSGEAPAGFGFKKINHDKYEFRVDIKLRVIVKVEGEDYYLVLAGNHDEVKRYLRHHRV